MPTLAELARAGVLGTAVPPMEEEQPTSPVTLAALARSGRLGATVPPMAEPQPSVRLAALARAGLLGGPLDYSEGRPSPLAVLGSMPREERTAPPEGPPTSPPPMLPTLSGVENRPSHHSAYQPREAGRFTGPPAYPRDQRPRNDAERAVEEASVGIDYSRPVRRPPAVGGFMNEQARPAYSPFVRGLPQSLQPAADRAERFGNVASTAIDEMTGVPAAARAGEALAEGDMVRGVGNALMAAPSRFLGLPGWLMTQPAEAQAPDPRLQRIKDLDTAIAKERKTLDSYANKQFPSTAARNAANKAIDDAITRATTERDRLQGEIDAEAKARRQHEEAAARGAQWAKTPFARRYPGASEGLATAGAVAGFALPFFRTRGATQAYTSSVADLDARVRVAVDRANNARLSPANRTQAAADARAMQAQRDQLVAAGPATGGHVRAFAEGAVPFEATLVAPLVHDYLAGGSDPSGELRNYTMHSINPVENPGEVLGRYGLGLGFGGVLGEAGHILGGLGADVPAGHAGEVSTLKRQYQAPRRRSR